MLIAKRILSHIITHSCLYCNNYRSYKVDYVYFQLTVFMFACSVYKQQLFIFLMDIKEIKESREVFRIEKGARTGSTRRMQWGKKHDDALAALVKRNSGRNWKLISVAMKKKFPEVNFTSKNCRARWKNSINPDICKAYLNDAEELILIAYHSCYRNKWSKISRHLPRRHNNMLRNSFYGNMRRVIKKFVAQRCELFDTSPLAFVQHLYIVSFVVELLNLPQVPEHKNPIVPLYVYMHIKERKITREMCREYVMALKEHFARAHSHRPFIQLLKASSYEELMGGFFEKLVQIIKNSITSQTRVTDSSILELVEQALPLNTHGSSNDSSTLSPEMNSFTSMIQMLPFGPVAGLGSASSGPNLLFTLPPPHCTPQTFPKPLASCALADSNKFATDFSWVC